MGMNHDNIRGNLARLGDALDHDGDVELLLIGGAAGVLTGEFASGRTTTDCDVIRCDPHQAEQVVREAALKVAAEQKLPDEWLSFEVARLDILPDGWHTRKVSVGSFGRLRVFALSRRDLLATKFYAGHPRDVQDIADMVPTAEELDFVRSYLDMLRVPSRQADLDQIASGLKLVDAFGGNHET